MRVLSAGPCIVSPVSPLLKARLLAHPAPVCRQRAVSSNPSGHLRVPRDIRMRAAPHENGSRPPAMDSQQLLRWTNRVMPWPCTPEDIGTVLQAVDSTRDNRPIVCLDTLVLDMTYLRGAVTNFFESAPRAADATAVRALVAFRIAAANRWITTTTDLNGNFQLLPAELFSQVAGGGRVPRRKKALLLEIAACQKFMEDLCAGADRPASQQATPQSGAVALGMWLARKPGPRARLGQAMGHPKRKARTGCILYLGSQLDALLATCDHFMRVPEHAPYGPGMAALLQDQLQRFNTTVRPWHDLSLDPMGSMALLAALGSAQRIDKFCNLWQHAAPHA